MTDPAPEAIAAVAIGRNEGARLVACLTALAPHFDRIVYVDSGSTDGSVEAARRLGADVVTLDMDRPFTAARARNAGVARLAEGDLPALIHFFDGDCILVEGWLDAARAALAAEPDLAVVCGRRREIAPEASVYNRLIDIEWDTPVGEAKACGGDALMRSEAFQAVGGFNPGLIAGEEPELCLRLRAAGWRIRRLDHEMVRHDANMTRFGQWWQRARRAGHTYAEGAAMHGAPPERHNVAALRRTVIWGLALPLAALLGLVAFGPWALALLLVYPLQVLRLARRDGDLTHAAFLTLAKLAEAQGALGYWANRLRGRHSQLIEYK